MFGILKASQVEDILHRQCVGRIGCHANGKTYVVPVSYAYDGIYIYAHDVHEGMKMKMMRQNPEVCFQVDAMENMANWKSVICWGTFGEVTNEEERMEALKILLDRELPVITSQTVHISPSWPFHPHDYKDIKGIVFRIYLTEKTGRFEYVHSSALTNFI